MAVFSVVVATASPPGQGSESGGAFLKVDGREAVLRSVELFLNRDNVKQIQLVVLPAELEEAKAKYGAHLGFSGVKLVGGGPRWIEQISAAARNIDAAATHVVLHDAARPIVPYLDIDALLDEAQKRDAVALTAPVRTTLVEIDEGGSPMAFHSPKAFMQLLTPQAYSKAKFQEMATSGRELHPSLLTLLKGSPLNIRIGGQGDGPIAKMMLGMLPKQKSKAPSGPFEEAQW
ncbi:MAG TPA: 2-C-methyl-D-erythritol 4-phosphate cytidylyltransferase [Tepidisphaeraceae bacterium]|jgi:2-C-methyl-D-erythritol 4-phosphate cytidylyltransferase|nr:2-C-methyl-D-erythritol 4-phosphate cytidylyltransferase [Tepidisphaeraceae bacterium]